MRRPRRAVNTWATAIAAALMLGLTAASCGILSPTNDCAQRANCPGGPDDATTDEVGLGAESGDDETGLGGEASDDSTDVMGDDGSVSDGPVSDGNGEPDVADADARDVGDAPSDALDGMGGDVRDVVGDTVVPDGSDGCSLKPEDCTNGIDDNCDGKIDCADPQCAAYLCAPPVPTGWSGPVALAQAATPAVPPGCQTNYGTPISANSGLNPPGPATCGTCTCNAAGETCSAMVHVDHDTSCNSGCNPVATTSGMCATLPGCTGLGASFSVQLPAPTISGGTCTPSTVPPTPTIPPVTWSNAAQVCTYTAASDSPGGCAVGAQCVLGPTGAYGTKVCVYSTASSPPTSCPAGYGGGAPMTFFRSVNDSRGCSNCSCTTSSPNGGSCSGSLAIFASTAGGCTGTPPATYTMNNACSGNLTTSPLPGFVQGTYSLSPGTCTVQSQPQANGTATPASPITVCCM
jgi:hypothetical protein